MTIGWLAWAHPAWLLLLPLALLPLLRDGRAAQTHSWLALLPPDRASVLLQWLLRAVGALAVASIVLGMAGLYRAEYEIERVGQGAEIALLLDRSRSMDERFASSSTSAGGPTPGSAAWYAYNQQDSGVWVTKGQAARKLLGEFAAQRQEDRFAMAVFSTVPMRVLDFTQKTDVVQAAIAASEIGRGLGETDIAAALLEGLSFFDNRPYTGSRIVLLVSDGGDHIDPGVRQTIVDRLREQRVSLYWIYIRSARSPGLSANAGDAPGAADTVPEVFLHRFFQSTGAPYRAYEAENPEALKRAIADVGRLENLPITYRDLVPRRDLTAHAYALALLAILLLLASRWTEGRAWR
ncbi:vWA domain-containing protein [Methylibium sp.]|uniref:vWA domain-containing protein n=1 Tax=Methylibium sp. TaxID=2067992 RepID=UPI003D0D14BE